MNLTKENYEKLKKYEQKLFTACYCSFVRLTSREDMLVLDAIYREVFHTDKGIVGGCNHCVYEACKKLGNLFFADKKKYEEQEKAIEATETAPIELIQPECATTSTIKEKAATKQKRTAKNKKK